MERNHECQHLLPVNECALEVELKGLASKEESVSSGHTVEFLCRNCFSATFSSFIMFYVEILECGKERQGGRLWFGNKIVVQSNRWPTYNAFSQANSHKGEFSLSLNHNNNNNMNSFLTGGSGRHY